MGGEYFSFGRLLYFIPKVLSALPTTLLIVIVATAGGLVIGMILALVRIEKVPVLSQISLVAVSFLRGTPIIIQMFIVYYGLPLLLQGVGVDIMWWDKIYYIFVTYALNTAAFFSEIIRSSVLSVPKQQREAAAASGLTKLQTYRRVVIPQSISIAIPSLGMSMTGLLQDTSLAFTLGILDVIGRVRALGAITSHVLEGYIVAACIFILLSIGLEKLFGWLERKTTYRTALMAA
ncbi:MAG: amino acid ABC transporter permease [Clostridiales Family XIII bacterium]|nr:amino acid ABC transporter permease [Clostridiales Family XIII bacterium]